MRIYVGFSKPASNWKIGAWLIRLWQWTEYSHTFLVFDHEDSHDLIVQASHTMVNMVTREWFFKSNTLVTLFTVEISDAAYAQLWSKSLENLGAPYSLAENIGIPIAEILHLKTNPLSQGPLAYKCSELVYRLLLSEGMEIPVNGKDPDLLDTKDIHNGLLDLCKTTRKVKRVWGK